MPSTPVDWLCVKQVVDMLREHPVLDGVLVEPALPGEKVERDEMVWVGDVDGTITASLMMAGRKDTDHEFTIPVLWTVRNRFTADECMTRLAEIKGAVHDVVVETADLESIDGVVSALPSDQQVRTTALETPADGWLGYGIYPIDVHSRLS